MLTQDEALKVFNYSNGKLYWKIKSSYRLNIGDEAGYLKSSGYVAIAYAGKVYRAHRLIYLMFNGVIPKTLDHINGNRSDNRIENLREATDSQNQHNRKVNSKNPTKCKNVRWIARIKRYWVALNVNKQCISLGYFKDLELADLVAQEARNKYHGQFAKHF